MRVQNVKYPLRGREIFCSAESEIKSTRRRSDFTRRQAHFTLQSNISPTCRVDFVEKSTSEEVLFSGADVHKGFRKTAKPEPTHIFTY